MTRDAADVICVVIADRRGRLSTSWARSSTKEAAMDLPFWIGIVAVIAVVWFINRQSDLIRQLEDDKEAQRWEAFDCPFCGGRGTIVDYYGAFGPDSDECVACRTGKLYLGPEGQVKDRPSPKGDDVSGISEKTIRRVRAQRARRIKDGLL